MALCREALRAEVQGLCKSTIHQQASLTECRTTLLKQVQHFHELQPLYMVGFDYRSYMDMLSPDNVEDIKLYMPSSLPPHTRRQFCQVTLLHLEERIRDAEAHDALENLHHHLCTWSHTNKWKISNITGQIHYTRVQEWQACIDDHVHTSASRYHRAWVALLDL